MDAQGLGAPWYLPPLFTGVGGRRTARVYLVGDNEGIAAGEDDKVNEVFRGSSVCAATRPATDLRRRADWARLPVPGLPILAD